MDVRGFQYASLQAHIGDMGGSGTIIAKFQWCATSGGTYADVTSATTGSLAAGTADNTLQIVEMDLRQLDADAQYIRVVVIVGTATSELAVTACVYGPPSEPVSQPTGTTIAATV